MQYNWKKTDFTSPAGAGGGPDVSKSITWYVGTPYIDMTPATFQSIAEGAGLSLGDSWWLGGGQGAAGGNAFKLVKADAGLTLGQLVTMATPALSTAAALSTTSVMNWTAGGLTVNAEVDNWVWVTATGAALPQLRRIKSNTASALTVAIRDPLRPNSPQDQDQFETAATAGDVAAIYRPFHVIVNTATTVPCGVALGTVTSGSYTIIQIAGLAIVSSSNSGAATVVGQPAVGTAAGILTGSAAGAANLYVGSGASMIPLLVTGAAGPVPAPTLVNFTGV